MEGRTEKFTPGDNFPPGDKIHPLGQSLPLGAKLRMGLSCLYIEVNIGTYYFFEIPEKSQDFVQNK
jgi:hypothetical protein